MRNIISNKIFIFSASGVFVAILLALLFHGENNKKESPVVTNEIVKIDTIPFEKHEVIGKSVDGRDIEVYTFGNGSTTYFLLAGCMVVMNGIVCFWRISL